MRLLRLAFGSLLERKVRSLLTMLGIIIGVASVYAMLAIGNGAQKKIMEDFGGVNSRSISIFPDWSGGRASNRRPWRPFTESDLAAIGELPGVEAATGDLDQQYSIVTPSTDWQANVRGTDGNYKVAQDMTILRGRDIDATDLANSRTVAVLGKTTAKTLFGGSYPIGETIKIQQIPFEVIGVMDEYEPSWSGGQDPNNFVHIPRSTMRARLMGDHYLARNQVRGIRILGETTEALDGIEDGVDFILRRSRGLSTADAPDFRIFNFSANRQQAAEGSRVFTVLLAAMGTISLVVGGVGVMNIMLVSVAERTREIGLRMSVGARGSDILKQFLVEAIVLCSLGGLVGLGLGYAASQFAQGASEVGGEAVFEVIHTVPTAVLAFGSALVTGVLFGFLPARRASRLNPVEALRHE